MSDWPHSPPHKILEAGTFMITAETYKKELLFLGNEKLNILYELLISTSKYYNINLNAWALLPNHYHIILTTENAESLKKFISSLHKNSSRKLNEFDNKTGRKVWHNFWDTQITYEKSYIARINYVNNNPVHHGLVSEPEQYYWCSTNWFRNNVEPSFYKTVKAFKYDKLKIKDVF
jgi:putative transposase